MNATLASHAVGNRPADSRSPIAWRSSWSSRRRRTASSTARNPGEVAAPATAEPNAMLTVSIAFASSPDGRPSRSRRGSSRVRRGPRAPKNAAAKSGSSACSRSSATIRRELLIQAGGEAERRVRVDAVVPLRECAAEPLRLGGGEDALLVVGHEAGEHRRPSGPFRRLPCQAGASPQFRQPLSSHRASSAIRLSSGGKIPTTASSRRIASRFSPITPRPRSSSAMNRSICSGSSPEKSGDSGPVPGGTGEPDAIHPLRRRSAIGPSP